MKSILLTSFIIAVSINIYSQSISNIESSNIGNKVVINYTLKVDGLTAITLFFSEDEGMTWQGPLKSVTGDVGQDISGGKKTITWDVLKDRDILVGEKFIFKVFASSNDYMRDSRDSKIYKMIKVHNKQWMAENLNYVIQSGSWCYNDDTTFCKKYGRLYNWNTAKTACPQGWHLPTEEDWDDLILFLGGWKTAGGKLKAQDGWDETNTGATNEVSFSILPGGSRNIPFGRFSGAGTYANFWSLTPSSPINNPEVAVIKYILYSNNNKVSKTSDFISVGLSVRCVK
jgi:uncharacterized protein (TIGR02145 family)